MFSASLAAAAMGDSAQRVFGVVAEAVVHQGVHHGAHGGAAVAQVQHGEHREPDVVDRLKDLALRGHEM